MNEFVFNFTKYILGEQKQNMCAFGNGLILVFLFTVNFNYEIIKDGKIVELRGENDCE